MATPATQSPPAPPVPDPYPCSDGLIMAESPRHVDAILYAFATLRTWFANHSRVQVGANMFLYYQQGDSSKRLTPDLFVVRGLDLLPERSYKLWEVGRPPGFVLEVASPATESRDRGAKQALYASMGVAEYWRFDPTGYLHEPAGVPVRLVGSGLQGLGYVPLPVQPDGSIASEVLGLEIRVDDRAEKRHLLRFRDPATRKDLLTFQESEAGRQQAVEQWKGERVGRMAAQSARRRAERSQQVAERARQAAEQAQQAAEQAQREERRARLALEQVCQQETAARQAAEAQVVRLRAQIAEIQGRSGADSGDEC